MAVNYDLHTATKVPFTVFIDKKDLRSLDTDAINHLSNFAGSVHHLEVSGHDVLSQTNCSCAQVQSDANTAYLISVGGSGSGDFGAPDSSGLDPVVARILPFVPGFLQSPTTGATTSSEAGGTSVAPSAAPSAMTSASAAASSGALSGTYTRFTSDRFGFSIDVPIEFTAAASEDDDGRTWTSPDGSSTLTASGMNNTLGDTTASVLAARAGVLQTSGGTVTYRDSGGEAYSVSGYTSTGSIFYEHGVVYSAVEYMIDWSYPAADKALLDAAVQRSVSTFTPGPTHGG